MTIKHTPGPWRNEKRPGFTQHVYDTKGSIVCALVGDSDAQVEADARLIATSPELIELLESAYANLHRWTGTTGPGCLEWIEGTRKAIAKVKGGVA